MIKKNIIKIIMSGIVITSIFSLTSIGVSAEWVSQGPYWIYMDNNHTVVHKGWLKEGDKWYYTENELGAMITGAKTINGKPYFFADSGELLKEFPEEKGVIFSIFNDIDRNINEVKSSINRSGLKNAEQYYLNGSKIPSIKYLNADGTVATNTLVQGIGDNGEEHRWNITDEYGYPSDYKTKLELNGRVYMQIDDGWGGTSNITTIDRDTGEVLYITTDKNMGKDTNPMCLAKDEWWYGYGDNQGWHYINSMNKPEKNVWKQNDEKTRWFYLDDKGSMTLNKWIKSGENWYYTGTDGHMLTDTTIKGYYSGDEWHYVTTNWDVPTGTKVNEYYFDADGVYKPQ